MIVDSKGDVAELKKMVDKRGFLVEFMNAPDLPAGMKEFAQIYVATLVPGAVRGNHYHKHKFEWVSAVAGKIRMIVENVGTAKRTEITLDSGAETVRRFCIRPGEAHAFENVSDGTAVLVVYTNKVYDPATPDTYEHKLL
ncbi:MAG: WxcM-like domain-containing protein [Candidatus Aenigmarchaeota archaeon]|nr:WxcM-like domain-containing protein [Candidatus Aenigmarchaeota archaeon]